MPATNRSGGQVDTLVPTAARTTNGNSGALSGGWGAVSIMRVQLLVTAAIGTTPSLAVIIEDTVDGQNWQPIGSFATRTAAGREVMTIANVCTDQIRVSWTLTGTAPSFAFNVTAYTR